MKRTQKPKKRTHRAPAFFLTEGWPLLSLALSLVVFFKDWFFLRSRMFLSLDSTALYYPVTAWVHDHLVQGRLPFLTDLAYNGAPIASAPAGVLSPFLWLIEASFSGVLLNNLLFLLPFVIYLYGSYFLGRELGMSRTASLLLAFLWTYNGHQMAQLDHQNVAWAHAFFPWAFLCLSRYQDQKHWVWLGGASLTWGLCLFSGHPQIVFLEGLFFVFWALFYPRYSWVQRSLSVLGMTLGTLLFTLPATLFTGTFLGDQRWSDLDRYFHSWTPVNFMTLFFPWFFGRDQYDRFNSDYWWQYQFVEMQVAFSIAGLFFILWFFLAKRPQRLWLGLTTLFALAMALGKFFIVYPLVQSLPIFSFFRDPARYWFLATWVLGIGAAFAWDAWFDEKADHRRGRNLAWVLLSISVILIALGWLLLRWGQPLLTMAATWFIQHVLMGDSLHTRSLSHYLEVLPAKLDSVSENLDILSPRVWGPILFLIGLNILVWMRDRWDRSLQKTLFLLLVLIDLAAFRMPLGDAFFSTQDLPRPQMPTVTSRALPLIVKNNSPLPPQYGQYAFPNMNLISRTPVLPFYTSPPLDRYDTLLADLGWFAWVYKDRDLMGFTQHPHLLSILGVNRIVLDTPFVLPDGFKPIQRHPPYVYGTPGVQPRAWLADQYQVTPWPDSIDALEALDPSRMVLLESVPDFPSARHKHVFAVPRIQEWSDTRLAVNAFTSDPCLLVLQKTFLPGWRATVNGQNLRPQIADMVLTALPLTPGENRVELTYEPLSLRVGFFVFLVFLGAFILSVGCFLLA